MKILIISPKNKTVFNFRGDLVRDMIASENEVIVTGPNKEFVDDIYALGVSKFIEVPLVKDNTSIFGDIKYLKFLKKVIKDEKPDLVFSYTIKPVVYGSIAAKSCKVPKIYAMVTGLGRVYTSNSVKTKLIKTITKLLYKKAFKACEKVIFQNSDDIKEFVSGKYLPESKTVKVNGSGVNMERFKRTELPVEPTFLMVSRIIKEKGVFEYCEAARKVKREHPEAKFVLLGGFDASIGAIKPEDIKQYIDDGSIIFPGEVKDPVKFYNEASVFVLPSYYREGLPRTILEAMACGRPVVTTDWPGCREPIDDGANGYLVPIKDSNALAEKLTAFIKNKELIEIMGESAYKTCIKQYEICVVNKQMKDILEY